MTDKNLKDEAENVALMEAIEKLNSISCHSWGIHAEWAQKPECYITFWNVENQDFDCIEGKGRSIIHAIEIALSKYEQT